MSRAAIVEQALQLLAAEVQGANALTSPGVVKDFLRLKLGERPHEVFAVVFLDTQHRVIAIEELFRGTLGQTSVYPREVVKESLARNAAAVVLVHNTPAARQSRRGRMSSSPPRFARPWRWSMCGCSTTWSSHARASPASRSWGCCSDVSSVLSAPHPR